MKKWLAGSIALMFLLVPSPSSAATFADLGVGIDGFFAHVGSMLSAAVAGANSSSASGTFSGTLSSSNPLMVTFQHTMNQKGTCGGVYGLYFGDEKRGVEPQMLRFASSTCNAYIQYSEHTYAKKGTYVAKLYDLYGTRKSLLGTARIAVGRAVEAPTCVIKARPETAPLGQRVNVSWTSKNAKSASWVVDSSGKDYLTPPSKTPRTSGSATIEMNVIGNPSLTLQVKGDGGTNTCTLVIPTADVEDTEEGYVGSVQCVLYTSHTSAIEGDTIRIRWLTTGATYAFWNSVYAAGLGLSSDKLPISGQTSFVMPATEKDSVRVRLNAFNQFGVQNYCDAVITNLDPSPSASVSFASKTHTTKNPTLTGTATGLSSFTLVITGLGDKYAEGIPVSGEKWSHKVVSDLPNGSYGVEAYDPKGNLLGSGSFVVRVASSGSVSFNQKNYTTGRLELTGTATGVSSFGIVIGKTDTGTDAETVYSSGDSAVRVVNGKWSHTVPITLANGVYMAQASDGSSFLGYSSSFTVNVPTTPASAAERGAAVVGVYEGSYATPRGFQQHPEGTVNVEVYGEPGQQRDLILTSYEPVNWVLDVEDGLKITKIIVTGYYTSRVTNAPSGTEVEVHSYMKDKQYYYAYEGSGDSFNRLKSWISGMYTNSQGNLNANFQFPGYSASSIKVYVGYKG